MSEPQKTKLIRCDNCNLPMPYGKVHVCDEVAAAEHQLETHPEIEAWFRKGLKNATAN